MIYGIPNIDLLGKNGVYLKKSHLKLETFK